MVPTTQASGAVVEDEQLAFFPTFLDSDRYLLVLDLEVVVVERLASSGGSGCWNRMSFQIFY